LSKYRDDKNIGSICGYNSLTPKPEKNDRIIISNYPSLWGWGNWENVCEKYSLQADFHSLHKVTSIYRHIKHLRYTIEHDKKWLEKFIENIPENVKLIHCELKYSGDYCKTIVSTDSKYSMIIVDGRDRVNCILNSTSSLSKDGVLILDDSEREEYQNGVIHLKQLGYKELDFWGIAPGIFYNKCTSIFYRNNNCLGI